MRELDWIEFLKQRVKSNREVLVGIGDDCALVRVGREKFLLKSDLFLEGVHFKLKDTGLKEVGKRAVARVLSDFAACGGRPKFIGISAGLPKGFKKSSWEKILDGVLDSAKKYKFSLIGGDTAKARRLFLDIWGLGVTDRFIARSKAREGDCIFVSGRLGKRSFKKSFTPRLKEAKMLVDNFKVNSMIDISDGLVIDLYRLLKASKKGAVIEKKAIPVTNGFKDIYRGEDYELLFTVDKKDKKINYLKKRFHYLGRITAENEGYKLSDQNKLKKIKIKGYTHF